MTGHLGRSHPAPLHTCARAHPAAQSQTQSLPVRGTLAALTCQSSVSFLWVAARRRVRSRREPRCRRLARQELLRGSYPATVPSQQQQGQLTRAPVHARGPRPWLEAWTGQPTHGVVVACVQQAPFARGTSQNTRLHLTLPTLLPSLYTYTEHLCNWCVCVCVWSCVCVCVCVCVPLHRTLTRLLLTWLHVM